MSTQTDIPSHPIFDIDLEDEDYDDQEDKLENLTTTSQLRTPTELSNIYHKTNQHRKDHDRHVHFNKEVESSSYQKDFAPSHLYVHLNKNEHLGNTSPKLTVNKLNSIQPYFDKPRKQNLSQNSCKKQTPLNGLKYKRSHSTPSNMT